MYRAPRAALQAKEAARAKALRQERAWIILSCDWRLVPLFPLSVFPNSALKSGHYYPIVGGN